MVIEDCHGRQQHYLKGRFLGKGGFARVYEFSNLADGHVSACKVF
jgi:hypothetical protein